MIDMALDWLHQVLLPIGVGALLGFPAGAVTGWRARICLDRRKAA